MLGRVVSTVANVFMLCKVCKYVCGFLICVLLLARVRVCIFVCDLTNLRIIRPGFSALSSDDVQILSSYDIILLDTRQDINILFITNFSNIVGQSSKE